MTVSIVRFIDRTFTRLFQLFGPQMEACNEKRLEEMLAMSLAFTDYSDRSYCLPERIASTPCQFIIDQIYVVMWFICSPFSSIVLSGPLSFLSQRFVLALYIKCKILALIG